MHGVEFGHVYQLAHPLGPNVPHLRDQPGGDGQRFAMWMRVFDLQALGMKVFADFVSFHTHTGTHIDALGHWSRGGRIFSGIDADNNYSPDRIERLGIDEVPPLIGRGILIDVAGYKSASYLPPGTPIGPKDLSGALEKQNLELRVGDIVLFRTGWAQLWSNPKMYMSGCPGLTGEAAAWLADKGCSVIGADQWDVDVVPPPQPERALAVHALCLADRGIYLIENLDLEQLAADRVYEFCFVGLVPPIAGATGFPLQAVAIT